MTQKAKQVIVLRKDLNMRKGKMVAQGAHASLSAIMNFTSRKNFFLTLKNLCRNHEALRTWLTNSFTKICVGCDSEQELHELYQKAKQKKLICSLIQDAGKTEFNGVPTYTALAIGPAWEDEINEITGKLKLL